MLVSELQFSDLEAMSNQCNTELTILASDKLTKAFQTSLESAENQKSSLKLSVPGVKMSFTAG